MVKKRLEYVDAISGIMILRMVYTHCCEFASVNDHDVIYDYLGCFLLWRSESTRLNSSHSV